MDWKKTIFVLKSTVTKQVKTKEQTHAFLAERSMIDLSKSGKKATGKQFNYEKEDETTRKGIDEARRAEWLKWEKFMAVRPIEGEELQQLLREGYTPIGTQWIDTDKHLHLKRPGVTHKPEYKSRLVCTWESRDNPRNQNRQPNSRSRLCQHDFIMGIIREAKADGVVHHQRLLSW